MDFHNEISAQQVVKAGKLHMVLCGNSEEQLDLRGDAFILGGADIL
jgi:hypothetical protein